MTVFVETDFLFALAKGDDWLQERATEVLEEREIVTSPISYLELLLVLDRQRFDYVRLFSNLLDLVPVYGDEKQQIVLKAVNYFDEGMTPFDAFHAATAENHSLSILPFDQAYEEIDVERIVLEPEREG